MDRSTFRQNKIGVFSARSGSARAAGVGLAAVAVLGVAIAGYAIYTLAQPKQAEPIVEDPGESGIAPTQTIEGVLASVQSFVRDKEYTRAQAVLESAVLQFPGDQDLRVAMGDLMMLDGQNAAAYDQYVAAIEIGPTNGDMEFTAGTLANTIGNRTLAVQHYKQAVKMDPTRPDYMTYLAVLQMNLNQLDDAKANLALASQLAPDDAQIWAIRASLALRENTLGIAQLHIDRARELEPREPKWILSEAKIRKRGGEVDVAINLLTGLPEEMLSTDETLGLLAECYGLVGRPGDAASRYIDAAQADEKNAGLAFEAALWLERAGDRENALKWGRRARDLGHPRAGEWTESLP